MSKERGAATGALPVPGLHMGWLQEQEIAETHHYECLLRRTAHTWQPNGCGNETSMGVDYQDVEERSGLVLGIRENFFSVT